MVKKEMIAMLLAGGQGSRLGVLTTRMAKPAVPFGGRYRIIDFPLSNCINSGIDTVGVLTQYQPLRLNTHIGIGIPWDLDRNIGGVTVLPPFERNINTDWYTGTANAIYQNIEYMESFNPDYVLILSGDHIYKMDYEVMLDFHKKKGAAVTIAVMPVPMEEASRFGIVVANADKQITEFQEKPEKPSSNLASMGIYIFSWKVLREALLTDHVDPTSEKDFGKNIIPKLLKDKKRLFAYHFDGYWKDVGTVDSYYDAQIALLEDKPEFDVFNKDIRIFSNSNFYPPHKIGSTGVVKNSIVCNGCFVGGEVKHSIIGLGAVVEQGAVIEDSILLPDCHIGKGTVIKHAIVNEGAKVPDHKTFGNPKTIEIIS